MSFLFRKINNWATCEHILRAACSFSTRYEEFGGLSRVIAGVGASSGYEFMFDEVLDRIRVRSTSNECSRIAAVCQYVNGAGVAGGRSVY